MSLNLISEIILMIAVPFTFVALIMPFIMKTAIKIGAVDVPRGTRHMHKKITPKLGGLGIFLGFLLGYMVFGTHSSTMNAILIASFIIVLVGMLDDVVELGPGIQFGAQILAASVVAIYGQVLLQEIGAFGVYMDFGVFAYPITIIFIVACINCINFIDGLDGLSGGISSIYYLTIGIIATIMGSTKLDFILSFVMLGSTLGFLIHNFYPARVFAGDVGSNFMGLMIAIIALLGFKNVTMTSLIVPLFVLAVPILDTLFAIIRRSIKGQKITVGDHLHVHHQLLHMNFSVKKSVFIIYILDALFASASIIYVAGGKNIGYTVYGILLVVVIVFVFNTNIIYDWKSIRNNKEKEKE